MTSFDIIARLFGLLLGLAMAEVLAGFARTLRAKLGLLGAEPAALRIGTLTPMLGLLVVMDQTSFWLTFYELRDKVPLNLLVMFCVLLTIGGFYVLSSLVFPPEPARTPDFDAHFMQVRRVVVGGLIAVNLAALLMVGWLLAAGAEIRVTTGRMNAAGSIASFLYLPALIGLLFAKRPRANQALLATAIGALLVQAITLFR